VEKLGREWVIMAGNQKMTKRNRRSDGLFVQEDDLDQPRAGVHTAVGREARDLRHAVHQFRREALAERSRTRCLPSVSQSEIKLHVVRRYLLQCTATIGIGRRSSRAEFHHHPLKFSP
jgi:hypothetical protein